MASLSSSRWYILATALGAGLVGGGADVVAVAAHATRGEALDDDLGVNVDEQRRVQRTTQLDSSASSATACADVRGKPSRMSPSRCPDPAGAR